MKKNKTLVTLLSCATLLSIVAAGWAETKTQHEDLITYVSADEGEAFSLDGVSGYFKDGVMYVTGGVLSANSDSLADEVSTRGISEILFVGTTRISSDNEDGAFSFAEGVSAIRGLEHIDLSEVRKLRTTFANLTSLTTLEGLDEWDVTGIEEFSDVFANLPNLVELNVSNWDLKGVEESKAGIFTNTKNTLLTAENWKVYDVGTMFSGSEIESVDLSTWDTSELGNAGGLFAGSKVKKINIRGMNFSKTKYLSSILNGNTVLEEIDVTGANIVGVEGIAALFENKKGKNGEGLILKGLDTWDLSTIKYVSQLFSGARVNNLSLPNWDLSGIPYTASMFSGFTGDNLNLEGLTINSPGEDIVSLFQYSRLTNSNLSGWTLSGGTIKHLFASSELENVDLSGLTSTATGDFYFTFNEATVKNSNLQGWNVKSPNTSNIFKSANLNDVNLSNWDISSYREDLSGSFMFSRAVGDKVDLSNWKVAGNCSFMFNRASIPVLDLSSWDVEGVTNFSYAFSDATSDFISIAGWTPKKMTNFYMSFSNPKVKYIDVTNLDLTKVETPLTELSTFCGADKVQKIKGINTVKINGGLNTHSFGPVPFFSSTSLTQGVDLTSWGLSTLPPRLMTRTPSLYVTGYAPISHETVSSPLAGSSYGTKLQFIDFPKMTASEGSTSSITAESDSLVYLNLGDFRPTDWTAIGIVSEPGALPNLKYLHLRNLDLGVLPADVYTDGILNFPNLLELEVGPDFKEKRGSDSWGLKGNWMLAGHPETLTTDPEGDTLASNPGLWVREGHTPTTTTVVFESPDKPDGTPAANEEFELLKDGVPLGKYTTTNAGEFIDRLAPGDYEVRSTDESKRGSHKFTISRGTPPDNLKVLIKLTSEVEATGFKDLSFELSQGGKAKLTAENTITPPSDKEVIVSARISNPLEAGLSLSIDKTPLTAENKVVKSFTHQAFVPLTWVADFEASASGTAKEGDYSTEVTFNYTVSL